MVKNQRDFDDLMKDSDLQASERQSILQSVFPILLRVGVQQHVIHLTTDRDNAHNSQ